MRSVNIRSRWGCLNYTAKGTALSRFSLRVGTVSEIDKATPPLRHSSELGTRALSRWEKGFAEEDHRTLARAGFQAGYAGWSNIEPDVEVKQLELYDNSKLHRHERKKLEVRQDFAGCSERAGWQRDYYCRDEVCAFCAAVSAERAGSRLAHGRYGRIQWRCCRSLLLTLSPFKAPVRRLC